MKKIALGRGLDALIENASDAVIEKKSAVNEISIDQIEVNPWQPRSDFDQQRLEELAESIKNVGIIQPLTLRQLDNGRYQIIAGERRFRAAKMNGLANVPAYIREADDDVMLQLALLENIQRADLNPIEEALSYQRLIDECHLTQEALAEKVSKNRSTVTNFLRLLKLPAEIQAGLREKLITMGHARAIIGIEDPQVQLLIYQQIVEEGFSVRHVEELVRNYNSESPEAPDEEKKPKKTKAALNSANEEMRTRLSKFFGTSVKFDCNESGKGKITIKFSNDEELLRIMTALDQQQ